MAPKESQKIEKQQDWTKAAESGDAQRLKLLTQSEGEWLPTDPEPLAVLLQAAAKNQEASLKVLLDWGVLVDARAKGNECALHRAAAEGAEDAVRLLIKRRADVTANNSVGQSAVAMALRGNHLGALKELLRADAAMPDDRNELPLGVHAVVKEVQLEKQMREIKAFPTEDKTLSNNIVEADKLVWKAQRDHMKLLEKSEELKVAKVVQDFDEKIQAAESDAAEAQKIESDLRRELAELKVMVQTEQLRQNQVVAEIEEVQKTQEENKVQDEALAKETEQKEAELNELLQKIKTESEALAKAEAARDDMLDECQKLTDSLEKAKLEHSQASGELAATRAELEGLRRDKQRVEDLQAKASEGLAAVEKDYQEEAVKPASRSKSNEDVEEY